MALKIYINNEKQAFLKKGNNDLLFGIQFCRTYSLLPIKGAYYSGTNTTATSVKLVKVDKMTFNDIEETTLSNSVITYSDGQFKIDHNIAVSGLEKGCFFYLQFENGVNSYKSEIFSVQEYNQKLLASGSYWLASSTTVLASSTKITI